MNYNESVKLEHDRCLAVLPQREQHEQRRSGKVDRSVVEVGLCFHRAQHLLTQNCKWERFDVLVLFRAIHMSFRFTMTNLDWW